MQGRIKDPNWQGWQKMQHSHLDLNTNKNITIHYWHNPKTNEVAGGLTVRLDDGRSLLHVAPRYVNGDIVNFRAVAGHELIHANHNYMFLGSYNSQFSETVAHRYTYNVYNSHGFVNDAKNQFLHMFKLGYWGIVPKSYQINLPIF